MAMLPSFVLNGAKYMASAVKSLHVREMGQTKTLIITFVDNSELNVVKGETPGNFERLYDYFEMHFLD